MKSLASMRFYYNNSESLYMSEGYTKAQSLSGYGSIQIIKAQALLAMRKKGGGNINSIWENNEYG